MRSCLLIGLLAMSPAAFGQAEPGGAPVTPAQTSVARDAALNPALPTLFIVGDSTARNQADLGWGDHLAPYFDTARINIANRAKAGRSSRTYINEGLWKAALAEMKAGDSLLLQMGHNDGGDLGGPKPRGTLKGIGEESKDVPQTTGPLTGETETVHTFGWYLRKMIDEAKAKGVHVALLPTTVRNIWKDGQIEADMGYDGWIGQVAAAEGIPVLDMAAVEVQRLEDLGQARTATLFPIDHTHTSAAGAGLVAGCVVESLWRAGSPLTAYLRLGV